MDRSLGYKHEFRIWMDDEIISLYKGAEFLGSGKTQHLKGFLFEIRTSFMLKTRLAPDAMIDSERLVATVGVDQDEDWLRLQTSYRLEEYWMSDDEIDSLIDGAFDYAKQMAADPKTASLHVIPVVVGLDVYTVQLEDEAIDAAIDRAIRPDLLIPLYMWPMTPVPRKEARKLDSKLRNFLLGLDRIRVEDVNDGLALMETCPICLCSPTISAQISLLPCRHAFHNHCLISWLLKSKSCPLCRSTIVLGVSR